MFHFKGSHGAASCEQIVEAALSKVAVMEGQLRTIATDLRTQLAQEGGTLLEALPKLRNLQFCRKHLRSFPWPSQLMGDLKVCGWVISRWGG